MAALHNRVSNKELKTRLYQETEPRITISFYKYLAIDDPLSFRNQLFRSLSKLKVYGRIYIASEGINAQASVPESLFEACRDYIHSIPGLEGIRLNTAVDNGKSFWVLKIKIRQQIVADGIGDPDFDITKKGKYVTPEEFNRLTDDPATIVVDMRNHYEFEVGHFEGAIELPSDTFREQLPLSIDFLKDHKQSNIIMYCTGGIRCEKASAYLLYRGFENVFHLEGGIINYANIVRERSLPNKFLGKNFVFDNRLGEKIGSTIISHCHQCGKPCDTHVNCRNEACHLLFIQCDECASRFESCCSVACQETIRLSKEEQKLLRRGIDKGRNIFNKSRHRKKASKPDDEIAEG
jgi:UPF0176 protein